MYELIKEFEGFRKEAYLCPAGQWTIGYGSTIYPDGTKVKEGDKVDERTAEEMLEHYCENRIRYPKGNWTDSQKDALCSIIYNIGQSAFDKSGLKRHLERSDWQAAYNSWNGWIRAKGKILPGLVKRRKKESAQFFKDLIDIV